MKTDDFTYHLPSELIAQYPLPERDQARMLVLFRDSGEVEHRHVYELPDWLRPGDLLVLNDTRVIPARVFGWRRDTRAKIEVLFVEELKPGIWTALCRTKSSLRAGTPLSLADDRIRARVMERDPTGRVTLQILFPTDIRPVLNEYGWPPVPPYLRRARGENTDRETDRERYQTVYARRPGSVAAPTAGLHFTPRLLADVEARGVRLAYLTLHVGPGTFRPVKGDTPEAHRMDSEPYDIPQETAERVAQVRREGGWVVAVGTTAVRALETAASDDRTVRPGPGRTSLFIYPPFRFRVVDALLTNFHLPRSTLLMLVSALATPPEAQEPHPDLGRQRVLAAYQEAIHLRYRFYSYGDCMLLLPSRR